MQSWRVRTYYNGDVQLTQNTKGFTDAFLTLDVPVEVGIYNTFAIVTHVGTVASSYGYYIDEDSNTITIKPASAGQSYRATVNIWKYNV